MERIKNSFILGEEKELFILLGLFFLDRFEHLFGRERRVVNAHADRVVNGVGDI